MSRNIDPGGGSYLTAANTGVNFTTAMTVSLWVRLDGVVSGDYFFSRAINSPQRFGFGMYASGTTTFGAFLGNGGSGATHITGGVPRLGIWQHIVFTVAGGNSKSLYVDGKLVAAAAGGNSLTATVDPLTFGNWADHSSGDAMDGQIAEVAVWNDTLTYAEVARLYRGDDPKLLRAGNMRGYWPLNDADIGIDMSIFACHATPTLVGIDEPPIYRRPPLAAFDILNTGPGPFSPDEMFPSLIEPVTTLFVPMVVPGAPAYAPFIASATTLYAPSVAAATYAPFIDETTQVYEPTMRRASLVGPFIAPATVLLQPRVARQLVNVSPPAISGTAQEGQQLEGSPGVWSGTEPITYEYQWRRCDSGGASCVNITGATSPWYIVQTADIGGTLRVQVTAEQTA